MIKIVWHSPSSKIVSFSQRIKNPKKSMKKCSVFKISKSRDTRKSTNFIMLVRVL